MLNNTDDKPELGFPLTPEPAELEMDRKTKEEKEKVLTELVGDAEVEFREAAEQ